MDRRTLLCTLSSGLTGLGAGIAFAAKKSRLKTAICAYSFRDALAKKTMTYDDLVRLAVECDVDGLDLTVYWFPTPPTDDFLLPLKRLAYKNGVEIYSISVRSDMCKPVGAERDKEAAELKKWVDVAARLGAGHIRVFGGKVPAGTSEDEAAGWVAEVLSQAAVYAGSKGVILGLENHGGITAKSETIIKIVKKVDSPWVGVNVDTGNFERDAYEQLATIIPYAVNVQFKNQIRVAGGKQVPADWDRLTRMLSDGGYKGYLALEYEDKDNALERVPALLKKLNVLARKYSV